MSLSTVFLTVFISKNRFLTSNSDSVTPSNPLKTFAGVKISKTNCIIHYSTRKPMLNAI